MKRRNADLGKMRRSIKRNKITEGIYGRYDSALPHNVTLYINIWIHNITFLCQIHYKMAITYHFPTQFLTSRYLINYEMN